MDILNYHLEMNKMYLNFSIRFKNFNIDMSFEISIIVNEITEFKHLIVHIVCAQIFRGLNNLKQT